MNKDLFIHYTVIKKNPHNCFIWLAQKQQEESPAFPISSAHWRRYWSWWTDWTQLVSSQVKVPTVNEVILRHKQVPPPVRPHCMLVQEDGTRSDFVNDVRKRK